MKPDVIQKPAAQGNYASGRKQRISRITFHHIVGDAPGALGRFLTPGVEVSAHYVIGSNGTIYQCVDDNNTAYCDGSSDSNARSISIEHAGGSETVPYTGPMYAASAELVRYLIGKYGISDFQRHRDVIDKSAYPGGTACPGTLDVERILKAAKGEEVFNEGDRVNLNAYWFGKDLGIGKNIVGKEWKPAMYELFRPGSEFDFHFKVNAGDVANINGALKRQDANTTLAKNWKDAYYGYFASVVPAPAPTVSAPQDAADAAKYRQIKDALK